MEDEAVRRLMGMELQRMNAAVVRVPVPLSDLLATKDPAAPTRGGERHAFDRAVLARLAEAVPRHLHHRLRLPILFYRPMDAPGDAYVADPVQIEALQAMGEATTQPRGGQLWMGAALAAALARRWPTLVQTMNL